MLPFHKELTSDVAHNMALENFEKGHSMELEVKAEKMDQIVQKFELLSREYQS